MSTIDKIKAKVENVLHKDSTTNDPTGPHKTHAANKADPRVDSDRVGPAGNTSGAGGIGGGQYTESHTGHHTGHTGGLTGTTGTTGLSGSSGYSDPTGPHDSRLANKLDPRVDSDRVGAAGNTSGAGGIGSGHHATTHNTAGHHTSSHHTGGLTGTTGTGSGHSDPTGPHNSRLANQLDPRVDSDRTGPAGNTAGAGGIGGGQYTEGHNTGTGHITGHHTGAHTGAHSAGVGGIGGVAGAGGANPGSGNAPNTAGPHNSDLLNKADPRVDSDLSGGKTYGGNATYQ